MTGGADKPMTPGNMGQEDNTGRDSMYSGDRVHDKEQKEQLAAEVMSGGATSIRSKLSMRLNTAINAGKAF